MRAARSLLPARVRGVTIVAGAAMAGVLLAMTMAGAATASTDVTVSPRDNCGGFNGHVVWSQASIQLYGEVWDTQCPDATSVWLSWDGPGYENVEAQSAGASLTEGVNFQTATSATPTDIEVSVCSTSGGWHCGTPVDLSSAPSPTTTSPNPSPPSTVTTAPAPVVPTVTVTTPAPVVTVPVTVPVPRPAARPRALRIKLAISWTWDRTTTRLTRVMIGSLPASAGLRLRCHGPGCPVRAPAASGRPGVRRMLRDLEGRTFRAGDRLILALRAAGWRPERAEIRIRSGQVPTVSLLAG